MALCRSISGFLKSVKPVLSNPCFVAPSSVNFQIRGAARKGYREKVKREKAKAKLEAALVKPSTSADAPRFKQKFKRAVKTVPLKKPEAPNDDVILLNLFNYRKYLLPEVVGFHKEYHHPTVYNNPNAPISLKIEVSMAGKTANHFMKPFTDIAAIPHPIKTGKKKEVLVFCKPEHVQEVLSLGVTTAGGADLINKVEEGLIQPATYDYVLAQSEIFPLLAPLKKHFKDKMPKARSGTLSSDLKMMIKRFINGIEYKCLQTGASNDFGIINVTIGKIDMTAEQLEENFKSVLNNVMSHKIPKRPEFITWVWCTSPPSDEEFTIDFAKYLEDIEKEKKNAAEPHVVADEEEEEEEVLVKVEAEKKELMEENA